MYTYIALIYSIFRLPLPFLLCEVDMFDILSRNIKCNAFNEVYNISVWLIKMFLDTHDVLQVVKCGIGQEYSLQMFQVYTVQGFVYHW